MRLARLVTLVLALLALALAAPAAFASGVRTLIVRGLVARADGKAASGARVTARGAMSVSATVDERGRYSLSMPMGSAAALRNGAFRVEVRAEHEGRKLAFSSGAPALAIEVGYVPGTTRLRVRSNSPSATAAVITAFAQEGVPSAWVDADFGGAVRASGDLVLGAEDEVVIAGIAPAPGGGATGERAKPEPARTPAPIKVKPEPTSPPAEPAPAPRAAKPAPPVARPRASAPDSAALAQQAARAAEREVRRAAERAAKRTRDSLAAVRRAEAQAARRARPAPVATRATQPPAPAAAGWVHASPADSLPAPRTAPAAAPPVAAGVPPGATPGSRVVPIEPFAPPPTSTSPDTCACRLRGTVEVEWEERPLEKNVLVELSLEGPARQNAEVDLYMGPPREFRLGPLPCGDYRLVVRPRGKLRYSLVRGDSVIVLRCEGHTQQRVVLTPAGR